MEKTTQSAGASKYAIQHHYDTSNDFYGLWLDKTRTYSCALFESGEESLEEAQINKLDYHIRESRIKSGQRLLDIGCGWGSTIQRALETTDIRAAVGLTLSEQQVAYCERLNRREGVDIKLENWEDHSTEHAYDGIISIGAFEHFSRPELNQVERIQGYRKFFEKCHKWLPNKGFLSLQTIAYGTAERSQINQFILDEIFPQSDLPYLEDIVIASKGIFEIQRVRNDRMDYAKTFKHWKKRFKVQRQAAVHLVGETKVAHYEKYMDLFMIGFHIGNMVLYRLTMKAI
ncbi:MAG: cyclopropane-fatty-acyl-phospholipid synthase family protein [Bacteroidota bacterium]